jgi:protein-S-isoprenylcysteine O-methyltransferase Ste14
MSADTAVNAAYIALYVVAAATRAPYAHAARSLPVRAHRRRLADKLLLIPVSLGLMILPLVEVLSPWLDRFEMGLPVWARVLGLVGFAVAVTVHGWTHRELASNWSPVLEIREGHCLIKTGPYRLVRHPMYAGFILWAWSQGFALSNWLVLVAGVASFTIMYVARVRQEEALLIEAFGAEYKSYMGRTGRLFPARRRST